MRSPRTRRGAGVGAASCARRPRCWQSEVVAGNEGGNDGTSTAKQSSSSSRRSAGDLRAAVQPARRSTPRRRRPPRPRRLPVSAPRPRSSADCSRSAPASWSPTRSHDNHNNHYRYPELGLWRRVLRTDRTTRTTRSSTRRAIPAIAPTPYYRPPANYPHRYNNNNNYGNTNVNVNNSNNNYFNRFDKNQNRLPSYKPRSPIASPTTRDNYRGQTTYNGANQPRAATNDQLPGNAARPGADRAGQATAGHEGTYQGARTGQANATQRQTAQRQPAMPPTTGRRGGPRLSEDHRRACRRDGGDAETRRFDQWRRRQSGRRRSRCERARPQQHEGGTAAIEQRARQRRRAASGGNARPAAAVAETEEADMNSNNRFAVRGVRVSIAAGLLAALSSLPVRCLRPKLNRAAEDVSHCGSGGRCAGCGRAQRRSGRFDDGAG